MSVDTFGQGWTTVFLMLCNVLDERHVSRNATTCMLLRMSGT